ncbi:MULTISPECIES: hypothetical protein [unclassified Rathayibacter]|uniref:hypothetical protein n=1 Tax=unclassified Rathayibacter TaxID=2609250 RepID=UPI00188D2B67|nr:MULTISPECIES: hypothetical protein [unclassified Rathayibacter]MBF4461744.1 hypothetical protein [Rathayibacter sp. VKM Ac-2879]MBF4503155.1 hypothetical protein [Rathayibacter sp. VKM Ac-2878]
MLDIGHVLGKSRFVSFGNRPLSADAILLLLEQVEGDRVCVVSLKKTELLAFEPLPVGPDLCALPLGVAASGHELVVEQSLEVLSGYSVEPETLLVLLDDILLHDVNKDRLLRAVVPFRLTC